MYYSSQMSAGRSKWFVGSSRRRISGSEKITLAIAILIRQPPEKELEVLWRSSREKPIPIRI
jgi:hypothetical protein